MTQPTFPDGPPVPMMVEGVIDANTLRQLFADLATATLLGIREKGSPTEYTASEELTTDLAQSRLLSGAARAVQLRYRYDGFEWSDTIMAIPGGFRVVRCRQE